MKRLFFYLAVFTVLFTIGCSEDSITEPNHPVSNQMMNKAQSYDGNGIQGSIPLEGVLVLPVMFNSYYSIAGQIDYMLNMQMSGTSISIANATLNLSVKAILTDVDVPGEEWYISEETTDVLNIPGNSTITLEKSFLVQGSTEGMRLICRFLVTRESVALDSKWLSTRENEANGNSTEYNAKNIEDNDGDDIPKCIVLPQLPDWKSARFVIENASILEDIITFTLSYSGGCEAHDFRLVCAGFQESPLQVSAQLFHNNIGDPCDQWITEVRSFDLSPLKEHYLNLYDNPCAEITINLIDENADGLPLTYSFCRDDVIFPRPPLPPISNDQDMTGF